MGKGYQDRDYEVVDYQLYKVDEIHGWLRGPDPGPLQPGNYIAYVGAAQTFGCYVDHPFPAQISEAVGLPALNLGVAGAGPRAFLNNPAFLRWINGAKFAVVQVLSGRSVSNSLLESRGGEMLINRASGESLGAAPAYRALMESMPRRELEALLVETRANWQAATAELLRLIEVPKVLLWFSTRTPQYEPTYRNVHTLFGEFPQLVQPDTLEPLKALVDDYVQVVNSDGMPQPLFSRFTGKPTSITKRADLGGDQKTVNDYYPSPQMHKAVFDALLPSCRRLATHG